MVERVSSIITTTREMKPSNRSDGYVRSVKLKTSSSVFDRPITKIVLLEGTREIQNKNLPSQEPDE